MISSLPRTTTLLIGGVLLSILLFLASQHAKRSNFRSPIYSNRKTLNKLYDDIFNSTLGFEDIFVINLPSRTDHRDALTLTAAVSNIHLNWVDGVRGDDVLDKVLPPGNRPEDFSKGNIGSWRAHMNALQTIVERNLSSALILEDDVDWDLRIKHQLHDFALSSHALLQPLASNSQKYADPTYPSPAGTEDQPKDFYLDHLPSTIPPSVSAYGDGWDVLWLGHCGAQFPNSQDPKWGPGSINISKGRVIHLNDETVPEMTYLSVGPAEEDQRALYPQHTRFVHHMRENICSFGYAVSQAGARHILYEAGIKKLEDPFDILLRFVCEGQNGYAYLNCLTVQPPLFNQHRPAGKVSAYSDISSWGDEVKEKAETSFVRWSARMNLKKLLDGETDYEDQFPDTV